MEKKAFALLKKLEDSWWYQGRTLIAKFALHKARSKKAHTILDFGAGWGGMYKELRQWGDAVYALEPEEEARSGLKERGYSEVFSSKEEALAHRYDLICLFDVLEHIEGDEDFLSEARSALTEGGSLLMTVPAYRFLWSSHDVAHHHFRRYRRREIVRKLEEAGYTVSFSSYWNMILFPAALLVRLLGSSGESSFSAPPVIRALFYTVIRVEGALMQLFPLPFGTSLVVIARK